MPKTRWLTPTLFSVFALLAAGCQSPPENRDAPVPETTAPEEAAAPRMAVARLQPLGGSGVTGTVSFTATEAGVEIEAHINGLTPGEHGFHIHEWGDCSAPDGTSAGGHFNPTGLQHGAPGAGSHAGDYGNVVADETGHGMLQVTASWITLDDGPSGILGRGVIVHENADDLTSQPTGAAGGRVACAVIEVEGEPTAPVLEPTE